MNADGKEHGRSLNQSLTHARTHRHKHTHAHILIRFPVHEGQMASFHW